MTDIIPASAPPAPRASFSEARATKVRDALARVRSQYLSIYDSLESCRQQHEGAAREFLLSGQTRPAFLAPDLRTPDQPKTEDQRQSELRVLSAAIDRQPKRSELATLREGAHAAWSAKYAAAPTRLVVGLMINAYPNARPHSPESYQEAVVDQVAATGLGPAPIAKACNSLVRTSAFVPSPAEVVAAVLEAQSSLRSFVYAVDNFTAQAEWAAEAQEWLTNVPLLTADRANYDRFSDPPKTSFDWARRTVTGRVSWV